MEVVAWMVSMELKRSMWDFVLIQDVDFLKGYLL
jgi:hypothetical protein